MELLLHWQSAVLASYVPLQRRSCNPSTVVGTAMQLKVINATEYAAECRVGGIC